MTDRHDAPDRTSGRFYIREVTQHGDWQIATTESKVSGFMAWAKMGRIVADDPISEPGAHVWFAFGPTRDAARISLLKELGLLVQ